MQVFRVILLFVAILASAAALGEEKCFPKTVEYLCNDINVLDACREECPGITDCELIDAVLNSTCLSAFLSPCWC